MKKIPVSIACTIQVEIPEHVFALGEKSVESWIQERFLDDTEIEKNNSESSYFVGIRGLSVSEILVDDCLSPEFAAAAAIQKIIEENGYEYIDKRNKLFSLKVNNTILSGKVWDKNGMDIQIQEPSPSLGYWTEFKKTMELPKHMPANIRRPWITFNE